MGRRSDTDGMNRSFCPSVLRRSKKFMAQNDVIRLNLQEIVRDKKLDRTVKEPVLGPRLQFREAMLHNQEVRRRKNNGYLPETS
jgi:hypothetical protein